MKESRKSIRIILINKKKEILLFKMSPGAIITGRKNAYWFTPGGGLEKDETEAEAALRELYEETGIEKEDVEIGPIIWYGDINLCLYGKNILQQQRYIVIHTKKTDITFKNFTEEEKKCINSHRWFSFLDIQNSQETIYPTDLLKYLPPILEKKYPKEPFEITP